MHFFEVKAQTHYAKQQFDEKLAEQKKRLDKVMMRNGAAALVALKRFYGNLEIVTTMEWSHRKPLEGVFTIGFSIPIDKALEKVPVAMRGWIMKGTTKEYWEKHVLDTFKGIDVDIKHAGND